MRSRRESTFPTTETSTGRLCRPCKCPHHKVVSSRLLLLNFRWPQDSPSPKPNLSPRPNLNLNQIVEDQLSRRPINRSLPITLLLLLNSTPQLLSPEVMLLLLLLSQTTQLFRRRTMPNRRLPIPHLLLLPRPHLNILLPPPTITPHPRTKVNRLLILQEDHHTLQQLKKIRSCTAPRRSLINRPPAMLPPRRPATMIAMPSARMTTIEPR